jgi:hypothetical protein
MPERNLEASELEEGALASKTTMYRMKRTAPLSVVSALAISCVTTAATASSREIACKTPANANSCYWAHGRLQMHNGNPAFRIWKVGTTRLLGVYSGPSVDRLGLDNETPELPSNVKRVFRPGDNRIFAEFEVCPLEPERPGVMQAVCIEAAKHIFVEKF